MKHHLKWLAPVLLILGLWGYHYLAANQAERDLGEALQELTKQAEQPANISYESIQVNPFDGDILFGETNIIFEESLYRFSNLKLDLTYWDFLTVYFRGGEYALQHLEGLKSEIEDPSLLIRQSQAEYKSDFMQLNYNGNFYDLLSQHINKVPYEQQHHLELEAQEFRSVQQNASWGSIKTDSLSFFLTISEGSQSLLSSEQMELSTYSVGWNPPAWFQEKYGFFIRGFNYEEDNIPVDSLHVQLEKSAEDTPSSLQADLYNELFQLRATTDLLISDRYPMQSEFDDGKILLADTSEEFRNFLDNAQQLLGINLPEPDQPLFLFDGPFSNPDFRINN